MMYKRGKNTGGKKQEQFSFRIPAGANVFLHQAFRCCPYAAMITSKIHDFLEQNNYKVCELPEEADVAVINTCGFNASRSLQGEKAIRLIRKRAVHASIIVCGCLTVIERQRVIDAIGNAKYFAIIGPRETDIFDSIFDASFVKFSHVRTNTYKERYSSKDPRLGLFQILVSQGCTGNCSYCVIRKAKGDVTSKKINDVVNEIISGVNSGYPDIFLVGDDISSYGRDIGLTVADLLDRISRLDVNCRFSCEAFEPSGFIELLDLLVPSFETGKFGWIVLPVQSGSNSVLRSMNRNYTVEMIENTIKRLRLAAPSMIISTDFIYGFPGESRHDFESSLSLASIFDFANFNEYEQRPGTPPVSIHEDEINFRREKVNEFLKHQGEQVKVLTKNRILPFDTWIGKDGKGDDRADREKWLLEAEKNLKEAFELIMKKDPQKKWKIVNFEKKGGGIEIEIDFFQSGDKIRLLFTPPEENAVCMASSSRFNMSLVSERVIESIDSAKKETLNIIVENLALKWKNS